MLTQTALVSEVAIPGTPLVLADLWRRRLDTLICGIANRDPYYLQLAPDQAMRQRLADTLVTIHRTRRLLAVGNSGQPFDEGKVPPG